MNCSMKKSSYLHLLVFKFNVYYEESCLFPYNIKILIGYSNEKDHALWQDLHPELSFVLLLLPFLFDTEHIFVILFYSILNYLSISFFLFLLKYRPTVCFWMKYNHYYLMKNQCCLYKLKKIRNKLIRIGVNLFQEYKMNFKNIKYNWR